MVAISNMHYNFFPHLFVFFFIEFQNSWDTLTLGLFLTITYPLIYANECTKVSNLKLAT